MINRNEFISALAPHAISAIGKAHGFLVPWAIAKSGVECGWNIDNVLIREANNCAGIKGGFLDDHGKWKEFAGVKNYYIKDSVADGVDDGMVGWRVFASLADCFSEIVNMWNRRPAYENARLVFMQAFERIYADGAQAHVTQITERNAEVRLRMRALGLLTADGKLVA